MSKSSDISYTCPRCQKQSRFTVWQSINVDLDPSLKQKVMDGSLFVFHCLYCGFSQEVGYSVLYHDQRNRYMVWWIPEGENGYQQYNKMELNQIAHTLPGYRLRLVPTFNRLREKIYIFDCGLDDRAIEILKRYVWSAFLEDQGIQISQVYFSDSYQESEYPAIELTILVPGGNQRIIKVSGKNGYPRALELLKKKKVPDHEFTQWRIIDHTYWDLAERGEG